MESVNNLKRSSGQGDRVVDSSVINDHLGVGVPSLDGVGLPDGPSLGVGFSDGCSPGFGFSDGCSPGASASLDGSPRLRLRRRLTPASASPTAHPGFGFSDGSPGFGFADGSPGVGFALG